MEVTRVLSRRPHPLEPSRVQPSTRHRIAALAILLLFLSVPALSPAARAWVVLDSNALDGGVSFPVDAVNSYAQSFVPSSVAVLEAVSLYVRDIGVDSVLNVTIELDDAGPSGDVLAIASINSDSVALAWVTFVFAEPLAINTWTKYWIVIQDNASFLNGYEVGHSNANSYLLGEAARRGALAGVWMFLSGTDLMFMTLGTPLGTYVEFEKWSAGYGDPGTPIYYILMIFNTGPGTADLWVNDTLPANTTYLWDNASDVPGYVGSWNDGSTWYYNFTAVPVGLFWFLLEVLPDDTVPRGAKLTNTATLAFADAGGYGDTWTREARDYMGTRPKTFYFHDDGTFTDQDPTDPMDTFPPTNLVIFPTDTDGDGSPGVTIEQGGYDPSLPRQYQQWNLTPPLADTFRVRGDVRLTLFLNNEGLSGLELVEVSLLARMGAIEVTAWTNTTPEQFYGVFEPYEWLIEDVSWNFPPGSYLILRLALKPPPAHPNGGNDLWAAYNATNYEARVEVLTTTYINVDGVMTYNATDPSFLFSDGDPIVFRANVTDPLGTQDICSVDVSVWDPDNVLILDSVPAFKEFEDLNWPPFWAVYRYDDVIGPGAKLGVYPYRIRATECNGVTHEQGSNFLVTGGTFLYAEKTVDEAAAQAGDPLTYTLYFNNTGPGSSGEVWVNDTLPAGTTYVDDTSATLSEFAGSWFDGTTYRYNFTKVDPGTHFFLLNVTVDGGLTDGTRLTNFYTLEFTNETLVPGLGTNATATTVVNAPNIIAFKEVVEAQAQAGDTLHYRIAVNNTGRALADVWVNDTLDPNLTFLNASAGGSEAGGTVSWALPGVAPGNTTLFLNATVNPGAPGGSSLPNQAIVDYADAVGASLGPAITNAVSTDIEAPALGVAKAVLEASVEPADVIHYMLWVNNTGTGTAASLWVNDTLDPNVAFIEASAGGVLLGGDVTWTLGPLAPGSGVVLYLNVSAAGGLPDGTTISNVAALDYTDNAGGPMAPEVSNVVTTEIRAPGLALEKGVLQATADPGDTVQYLLWLNNSGNGTIATAWVNDTLDANVTFLDASAGGTFSAGAARWVVGPVPPGGSLLLYLNVTVNVGVADTTLVWNAAAADGVDTNGTALASAGSNAVVTAVTVPRLTLEKGVLEATATPGDVLHYMLWVNNTGTGTAGFVWLNDTLDPALSFVNASAGGALVGSQVEWVLTGLAPGAYVYTLNVSVLAGTPDTTVIPNAAALDYADANGNYVGSAASGSAQTVVMAPVFTLVKVAEEGWIEPGGPVNYHIYYNNTGTGTALNLWIWETIPAGMVLVSATPGYSQAGNTLTWHLMNVPPGNGVMDVTLRALSSLANGTVVTNPAAGDYQDLNGNYGLELFSNLPLTVLRPAFTLEKAVDAFTANPGDILRYDLWYNQTTPLVLTNVWLNDSAPLGTTLVGISPGGSIVGNLVRWTASGLAPGSYTAWFTVRVDVGTADGTPVNNWALLEATNLYDVPIEPRTSNTVQTVVVAPAVNLTASAAEASGEPGDVIHFFLDLGNAGNGTAGTVWVNATLPSGLLFTGASQGGTLVGNQVRWALTNVLPGTLRLELNASIAPAQADGDMLQISAVGAYTDGNDNPMPGTLQAAAQVEVSSPELSLGLALNKLTADPGDLVTVTLTYDNDGNGTAGTVWLNLTLPDGFVLIADSSPTAPTVSGSLVAWRLTDVGPGPHVIQATMRIENGAPATAVLVGNLDYTDGTDTLVGTDRVTSEEIEISQPETGLLLPDWLWLLLLLAVLLPIALFLVARRLRGMRVEELFLIHRNGKLIERVTAAKALGAVDDEAFSAMLTAVQAFVRDSFKGIEDAPLQKLEFGKRKLWMETGKYLVAAVVYTGKETSDDVARIKEAMKEVEARYRYRLKNWKGDVEELAGIAEAMAVAVRAQKAPEALDEENGEA